MKYKNTKTGAIINSSCVIAGGDWVVYDNKKQTKEGPPKQVEKVNEPVKEVKEVKVENTEDNETIDGVTKKQIMQELDSMGIEYDAKEKKETLYNLMLGK